MMGHRLLSSGILVGVLVGLALTAASTAHLVEAEALAAHGGRRLFQAGMPISISSEDDLRDRLAQLSGGISRAILLLPPGSMVLSSPLNITTSVTLQGADSTGSGPASVLRCGSTTMSSLVDFTGLELGLSGVQLQDCTGPGVRISPSATVVTISDCVFLNFTRTLAARRITKAEPEKASPIDDSTAALAVYARNFAGNLTVRNTIFRDNAFMVTRPAGRRLGSTEGVVEDSVKAAYGWEPAAEELFSDDIVTASRPGSLASARSWRSHKRGRGMSAAGWRLGGLNEGATAPWNMVHGGEDWSGSGRRELQASNRYSMPLLEKAKNIHPGVKAGPWADDMETVVAVVCGRNGNTTSCNVQFEDVTFTNNTGVATGGLYVLCDGATRCNIVLTACTVTNNKLLWQSATEMSNFPERDGRVIQLPAPDYYSEPEDGPGLTIFRRMVPWLTYTYPLINNFKSDGLNRFEPYDKLIDASLYPSVTGRTLGAVVLHQRNSPSPGVTASLPAMMGVTVTGGTFSGNDGAAIMSTAVDFMELAGGNDTWSGGAPRHSADFNLSGNIIIKDHGSGWPAVYLRWPRSVNVRALQVTNSTGAVWLEEVRDTAVIEDSKFSGNKLSQIWLDWYNFVVPSPSEGTLIGTHLGTGQSQVVKVHMTALGPTVINTVRVTNCQFQGNPSYATGVLYIKASDDRVPDRDDQPGRTSVTLLRNTFTASTCRRHPECRTGERPLYIVNVQHATLQSCMFHNNLNGGVFFDGMRGATVTNSTFENNILTYASRDILENDNSYGGGGLHANDIGLGKLQILANTTFRNNTATVGGGAMFLKFLSSVYVQDCIFENNAALTYDGGALWMTYMDSVADTNLFKLYFSNNRFSNNTAGRDGGAFAVFNVAAGREVYIDKCRFLNNTAMLNPAERGIQMEDRFGGGAFFGFEAAAVQILDSVFTGNKVLGHAGGAIRLVDSSRLQLDRSTLSHNVAVMGGAIAMTRIAGNNVFKGVTFHNNTVVDPWTWPKTSSVATLRTRTSPNLNYIELGLGGAIYALACVLKFDETGTFTSNSAKLGGAVAMMSSPALRVESSSASLRSLNVSVPAVPIRTLSWENSTTLSYRFLFANNTALIGGAMYLYYNDVLNFSAAQALAPGIMFYQNLANGGGAIYMEGNDQVSLKNCRFMENTAIVPPLAPNFTGLNGLEGDNGTAVGQPCFSGGGGAFCIIGQASKNIDISSTDLVSNSAMDGAGMFLAEGLDCAVQTGCYKVLLKSVHMLGNNAQGRGGGVYWTHENVLQILTCPADTIRTFSSNGVELFDSPAPPRNGSAALPAVPYNISVVVPARKGPAEWYAQLPVSHRDALLSTIGGAVNTSASALYTVDGNLVSAPGAVFALRAAPNTTVVADRGTLLAANGAALNGSGYLVAAMLAGNGTLAVTSPTQPTPVVLSGSTIVNDTAWMGVPYQHLPCANWDNLASAGSDIATSAFFLMNPPRVDFYSSNSDIRLNVTVHDWLGQNSTGDSATRSVIIVTAESPQVSGELSIPPVKGTAHFTAMRLRAQEGLHNITLSGRLSGPNRVLLADQVQVYVRPCGINEFLSPKNLDECIPCEVGTFNFNVSATSCAPCPDNTECRYPNSRCMVNEGEECDTVGFMVPEDGFWHSSFYSEQVLECPNEESCTNENRSAILAKIQLQVWEAARQIQFNSSSAVADAAAESLNRTLVMQNLRRLLQVKAIPDDLYTATLLNITIAMLPEYLQSQCAEGYTGTLCGECLPGYGWSQVATCVKCASKAINNLYYALVTLLTLTLLALTVYSSLKEQKKCGKLVGGMGKGTLGGANFDAGSSPGYTPPLSPGDAHYHAQAAVAAAAAAAASANMGHPALQPGYQHALGFTPLVGPPVEGVAMLLDSPCIAQPAHPQPALQAPAPAITIVVPPISPALSKYEYLDPVVAAVRGQFPSAPGTPRSPAGTPQAPYPVFAGRSNAPGTPKGVPEAPHASHPAINERSSSISGAPPGLQQLRVHADGGRAPGPVAEGTSDFGGIQGTHDNRADHRGGSVGSAGMHAHYATHDAVPTMLNTYTPPASPPAHHVVPPSPGQYSNQYGYQQAPPSPQLTDRPSHNERHSSASYMKARRRAHQSTIVKIFVSYVQVLALLQNVPLDIPGVMDTYYRINNQATSYPGILVSLDCSLPTDRVVSKAFTRVILAVLAPFYIFVGSIIFFLVFNVFDYYVLTPYYSKKVNKKGKRKGPLQLPKFSMHVQDYLPRQLIVTFITIMFFFYPNVVQSLMTIFNCIDVDTAGAANPLATGIGLTTDKVWTQDFGEICYKGQHLALVLGLGVTGVVLFAAGWPLLSGLLVAGKLGFLTHIRFTEDMTEFFLADFKTKYVWWESVVMLRKLAIAVIVTFVDGPTTAGVQLLLVVCVLVISMALHLVAMPYHHLYTNNLELASMVVLLVTLYFSLYFGFSGSISDGGRVAISIIILVINISMVLAFVYFIVQAYWFAALYSSGLGDMDSDSRGRMTDDEIREKIIRKKLGPQATLAVPPEGQNDTGAIRSMNYQHRMASLYATAVVAGLRVGSTTTKVLQRMKTMLDPQPPSRLASREDLADPESAAAAHVSTGGKTPRRAGITSLDRGSTGVPFSGTAEDMPVAAGAGRNRRRSYLMQVAPAARDMPVSTSSTATANAAMFAPSPTPSESGSRGGPLTTHGTQAIMRSRLAVASTTNGLIGPLSSANALEHQ